MKDYIYKRIVESERIINQELDFCLKYRKAKDIKLSEIREKVMKPLEIKSMPPKYKEQINAILWFCWKREIEPKFLYPVLFEGRLYLKWDNMPEDCRMMVMSSKDATEHRPYPVFVHHFTEGMEAEKV